MFVYSAFNNGHCYKSAWQKSGCRFRSVNSESGVSLVRKNLRKQEEGILKGGRIKMTVTPHSVIINQYCSTILQTLVHLNTREDYRAQAKRLVCVYPPAYEHASGRAHCIECFCVCACLCNTEQLQVAASTHHWMISVIWASQCATLSFLSASSLISSSTCLWLLLRVSYMDFSWKKRGRVG